MPPVIGGHLVSRALKNEGVSCIFTLCGGHIAPIYDGCLRDGIDMIDTRHEQAAVHAADGWARLTRQVGVAVITAGPGVTRGSTDPVTHPADRGRPGGNRGDPRTRLRCRRRGDGELLS